MKLDSVTQLIRPDKLYNRNEFRDLIIKSAEYLKNVDDAGSVDFEYSRLWDYFNDHENILDEFGGI